MKYDIAQSLAWRYLTRNRHNVKLHISWTIHIGTCRLLLENLLGDSALANYVITFLEEQY